MSELLQGLCSANSLLDRPISRFGLPLSAFQFSYAVLYPTSLSIALGETTLSPR